MAANIPVRHYKTSEILGKFAKLAQTSQYYVYLAPLTEIAAGGLKASGAKKTLKELLTTRGVDARFIGENLGMLCSEAALPGNSFATSEMTSDFPGVTQKFPYRKIYNDLQLTFYVDDEYKVIKFFEGWMSYIASPYGLGQAMYENSSRASFRFNYPDAYKCNLYVAKFNKDAATASKIAYRFINAFPIDITTMPVSYDTSDILKCSVAFSYDRYIFDPLGEYIASALSPSPLSTQQEKAFGYSDEIEAIDIQYTEALASGNLDSIEAADIVRSQFIERTGIPLL